MRFILGLLLFLWVSAGTAGGAFEVTVGSDGACDYTSIQSASFNAPASDVLEIKLAKNVVLSSIQLLDDRNTIIGGGYDTCFDATPSGRTVLDGIGFNGPIFVPVESTSQTSEVQLVFNDLEITEGNSNTSGGAIAIKGSWKLSLNNVWMHHNASNGNGGAISMESSSNLDVLDPWVVIDNSSIISFNSADNGGGLACDGGGRIDARNMQITVNQANVNGGGVFLTNDCLFNLNNGELGLFQGVAFNEANGFGGGIFATNDALVWLISSPNYVSSGAAAVYSNTAANGGGIGLTNNARLWASNALINNNTASSTGGGIRSTGSHILIERTITGAQCHQEIRCSQVSGNSSTGSDASFAGGGAIATFGGSLFIHETYIENNEALFGSAIRARFMPGDVPLNERMNVVGSVFAKNEGAPQVLFLDNSSANITFSTFVDNSDMDRVIELDQEDTVSTGNEVLISGSIFEHFNETLPAAELTTTGQFPVGDCNRVEPNSTGDLFGQPRSPSYDVIFENRALGDYRLVDDSPLIDWCDSSLMGLGSNYSANGFSRPVDSAEVDNVSGTYDLGALERYELDLIFKDEF